MATCSRAKLIAEAVICTGFDVIGSSVDRYGGFIGNVLERNYETRKDFVECQCWSALWSRYISISSAFSSFSCGTGDIPCHCCDRGHPGE